MAITYDRRTGQFRGDKGRFISRSQVVQLVNLEKLNLESSLKRISRRLVNNDISLSQWQIESMQAIKDANLRMLALSAGGKNRLTNRHYGRLGNKLRQEYARHRQFGIAIKRGELTVEQIVFRSGLYAQSSSTAFYNGEQLTKASEGFKFAKRSLDANAKHCRQCPGYDTGGEFLPINQVIIPGHICDCRGNCRCIISYKK